MNFSKTGLVVGFLSFTEASGSIVGPVCLAVTFVVIVAQELWPGNGYLTICNEITGVCGTAYYEGICLMTTNSINVCAYSYAAAAIGIIFSLFTMFAACMPALATLILSLVNSCWYLGYAITVTVYNQKVTDANNEASAETAGVIPVGFRGNYRNMVIALAWTIFALCAVSVPLALKIKGEKKSDPSIGKGKGEADMEMPQYAAPPPPPPAAVV